MPLTPSDIRFIFYLPNLRSYLDRVDLVGTIAGRVGRGVLVTSRADAEIKGEVARQLEVIEVPPGRSFPGRTALAASSFVGKLMDTGQFNVVHDTFAHLAPLFLRRRNHPGQAYLTSYYNLAEWELRNWVWPRYRLRSITDNNLRQWVTRSLSQRAIALLADCVVVQAPGLADRVSEVNSRASSKLEWIPNNVVSPGVDLEQADESTDSDIRLLWVGGFSTMKGADQLLDLLARAKDRGVPLRATAVGTSSPLDRSIHPHIDHLHLRRRIESEGLTECISFIGRVAPEEMDGHYRDADWLIHVTQIDGSPRVVLEALARGLPVIGSRHPGVTVLDPGDDYILYAEPFDPDAVLDRLIHEKSNTDEHRARSRAGARSMAENYSSDAISERYVNLYLRLLSQRVV